MSGDDESGDDESVNENVSGVEGDTCVLTVCR